MHSSQDAGDIVADRGRLWFPQSGYALDTDGTLVLEVSQGADTHDRSCARQMPLGVLQEAYLSREKLDGVGVLFLYGGRSVHPSETPEELGMEPLVTLDVCQI